MITKTTGDRGLLKQSFLLPNEIKTQHTKTTFRKKTGRFFPTPLQPASLSESNIISPFKHRKCSLIVMIKILTMLKLYPCLSCKSMFYTLPQHPTLICVEETNNRNKSRRKVQLRTGGETSDLCKKKSVQANINT